VEPTISHRWHHLLDLPPGHESLASTELRTLKEVWDEQRESLESTGGMREFMERLRREWAIETGVIERVYSLDRGITELLIERGIDANLIASDATDRDPHLVAEIIRDHEAVVEGLFAFIGGDRELTTAYIKELHSAFCRHQTMVTGRNQFGNVRQVPLVKGVYKTLPNNPTRPDGSIHEYCPPEHVASEMDRLLELHHDHVLEGVAPEVEAAWLHHRFSQIHPFQDGNGRVARALASLVFIKAGWFPLTVTRDRRERYIRALEKADESDLAPLVDLFASIHRRAFTNALGIASTVRREERLDQVIDSIRDAFEARASELRGKWERAKETAGALLVGARDRLESVAGRLHREVGPYTGTQGFFADSEPDRGARGHYFRYQVIETAKRLDYFANLTGYHAWARLVLRAPEQAEILVSLHGLGREYRGVMAASMCFFRREQTEEQDRQITDIFPLCNDVFQTNYREDLSAAQARFSEWLDQGLVEALEIWRKGF